ncbi:MAG: hypothetical protein SFY80_11140 [Verrucomicrobiota bacterium]|nr:hypothetical protein [Verrucomicrobiota bacterium]
MANPKSLDQKLARILASPSTAKDFIIADAKDADMAFGITAPGPNRTAWTKDVCESVGCYKTLTGYREQIRAVIAQGLVDIMLLSASNVEQLAMREKLFENSPITPAARANDTTDIWVVRGGKYLKQPSRAFRTATLDHIMHGRLDVLPGTPFTGADLGLYSITFTNNLDTDLEALERYHNFRIEAERKGFRHFLEIFDPNVESGIEADKLGQFLNDHIVRTLAGVTSRGRPVFLKIPYHGPRALEELVSYDPNMVVGILGGGAGTTLDAFKLIADAQKYGARVALFGRKINLSEHPLSFIEMLRRIVEGQIKPEEAVKAYHAVLERLGIAPQRPLQKDLVLTETSLRYS